MHDAEMILVIRASERRLLRFVKLLFWIQKIHRVFRVVGELESWCFFRNALVIFSWSLGRVEIGREERHLLKITGLHIREVNE